MTRDEICANAACKLSAAGPTLGSKQALVGIDGFVDEILAVVDQRTDFQHFQPIKTIAALGKKILAATGQSSNYELIVKQTKLGGNGPIMANALAAIGLKVTYVGCLGYPTVHPVFEELAKRAEIISIANPAHTDALEFEDGKLMLGKLSNFDEANWDTLIARCGRERLMAAISRSSLIGMVNWTMLPHMTEIFSRMLSDVLPQLARGGVRPTLFIDLTDPEKRTHDDIVEVLRLMTRMQEFVDVTLGLNLKESGEVAQALGLAPATAPETAVEQTTVQIRAALNVHCVVVHPRTGAAAAVRDGSAIFAGPFVREPKISTGAGDHFNAGFATGRVLGFTLEESLCLGVAVSGYYVRTAISPSAAELATFITELPPPQ